MRSFPGNIPVAPKASYSLIKSPIDPRGHFLALNVCILVKFLFLKSIRLFVFLFTISYHFKDRLIIINIYNIR